MNTTLRLALLLSVAGALLTLSGCATRLTIPTPSGPVRLYSPKDVDVVVVAPRVNPKTGQFSAALIYLHADASTPIAARVSGVKAVAESAEKLAPLLLAP